MKAEHRKELQTNSLADFLGRTVRNVRGGGGTGISWIKVIVVGVVLAGLLFTWVFFRNKSRVNAELWMKVQVNTDPKLLELADQFKDTKQGQAARFTLAFERLWMGVQLLGDPNQADEGIAWISKIQALYRELAEEAKDDPERSAEAKYHIAVCAESLSAYEGKEKTVDALEEAKKTYEDLAKSTTTGSTAYGKLALKRFEQLNNPAEYESILRFYREFKTRSKAGQ